MSKVKIYLDKGETTEEAENDLFKALNHHRSGNAHDGESFDDPAMIDVNNRLVQLHEEMYAKIIKEISDVLNEDYDGNI